MKIINLKILEPSAAWKVNYNSNENTPLCPIQLWAELISGPEKYRKRKQKYTQRKSN